MAIAGILFDKDGTLLDFNATWVPMNRAAANVVAKGNKALLADLLRRGGQDEATGIVAADSLLATANSEEIAAEWTRLVPDHGVNDLKATLDAVFEKEGARCAVPVPGLCDTIAEMKTRGLKLGLATSDSQNGAYASLAHFEVLDQFDFIAGYDSGFGHKPQPGMVHGFCKRTGLSANQVMVVGDNHHDLEMGRAAGAALCVGVLTGTGTRRHLSGLADHVINSIVDLDELL